MAAKRRGMTVYAWVNLALRKSAQEDLRPEAFLPTVPMDGLVDILAKMEQRMAAMEEQRRPWWQRWQKAA